MKWIVLGLALFQGGWLTFDGSRALMVGDYVTPTAIRTRLGAHVARVWRSGVEFC